MSIAKILHNRTGKKVDNPGVVIIAPYQSDDDFMMGYVAPDGRWIELLDGDSYEINTVRKIWGSTVYEFTHSEIEDMLKETILHHATQTEAVVFEIIDHTSEEVYFPLAVFPDFTQAVNFITQKSENKHVPISPYQEEIEELHIRKRAFGLSEEGTTVYKITRENKYQPTDDDIYWSITKTEFM